MAKSMFIILLIMHYTELQALSHTVAVANHICHCSATKFLVDCGLSTA